MSDLGRENTRCWAFHHTGYMVCAPLPCIREKVGLYGRLPTPLIFKYWWAQPVTRGLWSHLGICLSGWQPKGDGWTQQACCPYRASFSGSGTLTSVLSGSSAAFSVGVQSLQHLSRMSKQNVRCLTAVLNDTLLAECGTSASRCLNLQNGSLVLRRVEKDDEGQYEFVFHNTTRLFTLEVFGKLPS